MHIFESQRCISLRARGAYLLEQEVHIFECQRYIFLTNRSAYHFGVRVAYTNQKWVIFAAEVHNFESKMCISFGSYRCISLRALGAYIFGSQRSIPLRAIGAYIFGARGVCKSLRARGV